MSLLVSGGIEYSDFRTTTNAVQWQFHSESCLETMDGLTWPQRLKLEIALNPTRIQMQFLKFKRRRFLAPSLGFVWILSISLVCCLLQSGAWGQDGSEELDQAFDLKIKATSTRDLDAVVKLCKSAIEKGLDEEGVVQAKQLAASSSIEHAEQLTNRIFATPPDPRWQKYRTEALRKLKQAIEFQPELVSAHLMMARLNLMPNGDLDAARTAVEQAVQHAGDDRAQLSQALYFRASLSEDKEAQLADINQSLKINPTNLDALKFRAVYYFNNKDTEKGLEDINQWLSRDDVKPQDFLETVVLLRAMGKSFDDNLQREALEIIERGIGIAPEDVRFLEQRAEILIIRKEPDKAIAELTKLIEMDSVESKAKRLGYLLLRGGLYGDQEKYEEALSDYDAILKDNPNALEAIQARGGVLAAKGDFAASIKEFKKIERRVGANPGLMRQIAMLYNANEEPSKALKIYDELLAILAEDKFEEQPEDIKRGIELERQATWRSRGDAFLSLGKHQEAIEDYNRVLEIHQATKEFAKQNSDEELPEDDHVLNNLAWVLATSPVDKLRDGKRAVELATRAAEATEHKEAHVLSTLASAYAESGDFENAIKWIDKAIEINAKERSEKEDERNLEQKDSLQKEKEHYLRKEAFRELQNVEEEKAAKETAQEGDKAKEDDIKPDKKGDEKEVEKPKAEKEKGKGDSAPSSEEKKEIPKGEKKAESEEKSHNGSDPSKDKSESQEKKKSDKKKSDKPLEDDQPLEEDKSEKDQEEDDDDQDNPAKPDSDEGTTNN
jgi:tetratricopeptide (TPR) repeat protein